MNLFFRNFVDYFSFLGGMVAGMFLLRRQFEKKFASNPRLNVEAVRTLLVRAANVQAKQSSTSLSPN